MVVTHKFKLHLDSWQDPVTLDAVQGDTARNVQFSLYAENALWEIPANTQVMVRYRKSDNTGGCYDTLPGGSVAYHIVDNQITVHLVPQVLTVAGIVEMQIALFNSTQTLAAFSVLIRVQGDPSVGVLESENYVNLSTWLRGELDQRMAEAVDSGGYLNSKVDDLHSRILPLFSQGGLESGTGEEISQTTAIRSNLILLGGQELSVTVPAGVTVRCFFYDMVGRYTGETEYYSHSFTVYRDAAHIRLVAAYSDDSVVGDPAALAEKVGIFLNVNSHHSFRGSVKKHGFASFAQCTQEGYYQFDASEIGMIQDAPAITAGGILEVRSHFGPDAALQTIKTANGEIWFRIGNDPFQKLLPQDPHFLYVTVWHNGEKWVADKTFDELHDWILAGNGAYCFFDVGDILRLAKLEAEGLTFSGSSNGWETTVFISVDNALSVSQLELSGAADIPEGSDPRVFVNVTDDGDDTFSADMTFAQIKEAYNQNKMVCCNWGGYLMSLSAISSVSAEFSGFSYQTHYRVVIGNYNGVEKVDVYPIQYAERDNIPTTLPNPYKLTFDGAVSGEYDGSRPVNITIPQGGGGGNEWVKVVDLTTEEDLTSLFITSDLGGAPLSYNRLSIYALVPAASVAYKIFISLADDAGIASIFDIPVSAQRHITIQGYPTGVFETTSSGEVIIANLHRGIQLSPTMPYRQISLRANAWQVSGAVIPAGTKVIAYGKN